MILNPYTIAAVHTCTVVAPSARKSTASRQSVMPADAGDGQGARLARARDLRHHVQRDGFDRRSAVAAV